jgi:hypothetical protein
LGFIFVPDCRIEIFVIFAIGAKRSAGNREAGWRIEDVACSAAERHNKAAFYLLFFV